MVTAAAAKELAALVQQDIDALRPTRLFTSGGSSKMPEAGQQLQLSDAYQIQVELRRLREARGEVCCGFKVGCTSPTIQTTFGLSQPVRAYCWEAERRQDQATLSAAAFRSLAIEGELAVYVIDSRPTDVLDWVVEWAPVIELHHYVWDGTPPTSVELVGRNAIHAGLVETAVRSRGTLKDIPSQSMCAVSVDGELVGEEPLAALNAGQGFPGGPVGTFSWLAEQLKAVEATQPEDWQRLQQPDSVVITSSPAGLYPVAAGDEVLVSCCGMEVGCTVVAAAKL